MASVDAAREYAAAHGQQFEQQLIELVSIPSVSAESQHKADVQRAAEWLAGDAHANPDGDAPAESIGECAASAQGPHRLA